MRKFNHLNRLVKGVTLLAAVLVIMAPGSARSTGESRRVVAVDERDLTQFVDGLVESTRARDHIAGVAVAIVQGDRPLLLKGYGHASFAPARRVDPHHTLFRLASISKTLTWTLVMQQVERGTLSLNAPVNGYLPRDLNIPAQRFKGRITLRHLMAHAAGFEEKEFGASRVKNPDTFQPLQSYLKRYRPDRVREPGQISNYSNYGASLMGPILTRTSAGDFETLAEDMLLRPAGMTNTTYRQPYTARRYLPTPMPVGMRRQLSSGFSWVNSGYREEDFEILETIPAGAVSSTAADVARFMRLQLRDGVIDGTRIYGKRAAAAFRTPILKTSPGVNGWAHGFAVIALPGGYVGFGHGGTTLIFYSTMVVIPELDLGIFLVTNTATGRALRDSFPGAILSHFYPRSPEVGVRHPTHSLISSEDHFSGRYVTTRRAYSGLQKTLGLTSTIDVSVSPDGFLITGTGPEARRWRPDTLGNGAFQAVEGPERIQFTFDSAGRGTGWTNPNGTGSYERVSQLEDSEWLQAGAFLVLFITIAGSLAALAGRDARGWIEPGLGASVVAAGIAWAIAIGCYITALGDMRDATTFFYAWPNAVVLRGSIAALTATIISAGAVVSLVHVMRRPRGDLSPAWIGAQRGILGLAILFYLSFSVLVGAHGALLPWAS